MESADCRSGVVGTLTLIAVHTAVSVHDQTAPSPCLKAERCSLLITVTVLVRVDSLPLTSHWFYFRD